MGASIVEERSCPLAIRLFGPFEVFVNGVPLPRLRSRKGQWLLALLALRAGSPVHRAVLTGTLWPDSDAPRALGSLRMCLTDLRRALGDAAPCLRAEAREKAARGSRPEGEGS